MKSLLGISNLAKVYYLSFIAHTKSTHEPIGFRCCSIEISLVPRQSSPFYLSKTDLMIYHSTKAQLPMEAAVMMRQRAFNFVKRACNTPFSHTKCPFLLSLIDFQP